MTVRPPRDSERFVDLRLANHLPVKESLRQWNRPLQSRDEELREPHARNLKELFMPLVIDDTPLVRLTSRVPAQDIDISVTACPAFLPAIS
jgi:hypothetical protein